MQLGLGELHVGPAVQYRGRQELRELERAEHVRKRPAAGDPARVPADQDAELVLRLHDLPLELCHARRRARHLGLELSDVQLRDHALAEPPPREPERFPVRVERTARDLELEVDLAKLEIRARDAAHQREHDRALVLLLGQEVGPGGFSRAPDPAPDVELPAQIRGELDLIVSERAQAADRRLGPTCHTVRRDLGEEVAPGGRQLSPELLDRRDRHLEIPVLPERGLHQLAELGVDQEIEPGQVGGGVLHGRRHLARGVRGRRGRGRLERLGVPVRPQGVVKGPERVRHRGRRAPVGRRVGIRVPERGADACRGDEREGSRGHKAAHLSVRLRRTASRRRPTGPEPPRLGGRGRARLAPGSDRRRAE